MSATSTERAAASLLRQDFASFVRKAYASLNADERLGKEPYLEYLCAELARVAKGEITRALVNLPPRHLKTFVGSVCLPAWVILHRRSTKIMIVAGSEGLVSDMAYQTREILRSPWFEQVSGIQLAEDRSKVLDFSTSAGGGVIAFSIDGSITGRGADLIIVDDPVDIKDAGNLERLERVNRRFHTLIQSRLNNPKQGRIVVIAHRLHPNDLSGSVLKAGGWHHVVLPMMAVEDATYRTNQGVWHRKAGELLRPDAFDEANIKRLHAETHNPDFDTLYQQDVSGGFGGRISRTHFPVFERRSLRSLPVVLSIDPGQSGGPTNSFGVIQAWCTDGELFFLLDQFRKQCRYDDFRKAYRSFVRKFRPSVALIEATGQGVRLLEDEDGRQRLSLKPITPDPRRSKIARVREHLDIILAGRIRLPPDAVWAEQFISECVEFPRGRFDDQVDALTQLLDFIARGPKLSQPPPRTDGVVALKSLPVPAGPQPRQFPGQARGVVAGASRRGYRF